LLPGDVVEDETLYQQQTGALPDTGIFPSCEAAIHSLHTSSLSHSDWDIENWEPSMIETAVKIAQKWMK